MKDTVCLVATRDTILRYFPDAPEPGPASNPLQCAEFPLALDQCKTELGLWLAKRVHSTVFGDDASTCRILLPATKLGAAMKDFAQELSRHQELTPEKAEVLFQRMTGWVADQRKAVQVYGAALSSYCTIDFQWPVFGSARANGAETPEAYFDQCAKQIRMTGGIVLRAGFKDEPPPDSLLRTMATSAGGGVELLKRYKQSDPFKSLWTRRSGVASGNPAPN